MILIIQNQWGICSFLTFNNRMTGYMSIESWKNYSHPLLIYLSLPLFPHPHFSEALDVCHGLKDVELYMQVLLLE